MSPNLYMHLIIYHHQIDQYALKLREMYLKIIDLSSQFLNKVGTSMITINIKHEINEYMITNDLTRKSHEREMCRDKINNGLHFYISLF